MGKNKIRKWRKLPGIEIPTEEFNNMNNNN